MRIIAVIFVLICTLFGDWQQAEEIALPKGIQINDLTVNNDGLIWLLSSTAILKLESTSKNPLLINEILDAKLLSMSGEEIYLLRSNNRLSVFNIKEGSISDVTEGTLNSPIQLGVVNNENKPTVVALEPDRLAFIEAGNVIGALNTDADRFAVVPTADYSESSTPLYTLKGNRVYAWTGGMIKNPENYRSRVLYSSSSNILDLAVDKSGNLYILFADSIVVMDDDGKYQGKIQTENLPTGTELLTNPLNNNLIIFNRTGRVLKVMNQIKKEHSETITLNKNYPNPVDNFTEIEFTLGQPLNLTLTVYNLIGEPVKVLAKGQYGKGAHRVQWNADDEKGNLVPNGVYFYRLESNKGVAIKQLIVLR